VVKLHTDTEKYICMEQISKLEKRLKPDGFFMPHRSCLLNFEWVESFSKDEVIMKNGDRLDLSRRKYKDWKTAYLEWKFDRANR
jgi:DNA-binding LytR/AlgR family response regulator